MIDDEVGYECDQERKPLDLPQAGRVPCIDSYISARIASLMGLIRRTVDARMTVYGLTDAQWKPLTLLLATRVATPIELALWMHMDAGAMSRLLVRLERKELLVRTRSLDDRRVVLVQLTESGERAAGLALEIIDLHNRDILRGISPTEVQQMRGLIERMASNLCALDVRTSDR